MSDAATLRGWLDAARTATLSTLLDDGRAAGWPFGSTVPYGFDDGGRPLIVISDIAVHTKNLKRDPRASLHIAEPGRDDDPQAGWRVTLIGTMRPLTGAAVAAGLARYRARNPSATQPHGFEPWALDVTTTRYIAGFGKMGWL